MKRDNFSRAIIFTLNITTHRNQFFFLSFPSPSFSLSLSLPRWKGGSSPNGGQNRTIFEVRATTDSYCFLIGGRARAFEPPRERRRRVPPSLPSPPLPRPCPRKKVSLEIFSIKNRRRAPGRGSCDGQKPGTRRDASRRRAPRSLRSSGRGGRLGRKRRGVSFNYCSIVTHGPFQ